MGTPIATRGMRPERLLRAMNGAEKAMTPGELALLHDHATRDWRPVIATADLPRTLRRRTRLRVLARQPRRSVRCTGAEG